MALHEIGYLIAGGAFQCWFSGNPALCPNADKLKPAGISSSEVANFIAEEVGYEVSGFAVFARKGEIFEIKKKTGDALKISLPELNRETQAALTKTGASGEAKDSLWRFESLEEIFKFAMLRHDGDFLKYLRKDDLKTPMNISLQLEGLRQARIEKLLKAALVTLPIGYVITSEPCTYRKVDATTTAGSCAPPVKAPAYESPSRNSPKVLDVSLVWAQLEGYSVQSNQSNPPYQSNQLFVFQKQDDWIQMRLSFGEVSKRVIWLNSKDFPYKIVSIKQEDRLKHFMDFLTSSPGSSELHRSLLQNLNSLMQSPLQVDLESAGETKWRNGVLWVKVDIRSEPHCSPETSKAISSGWLPYITPGSPKRHLGWHSRGC